MLRARARLSRFVVPLLKTISRHIGMPCISLIAGAAPELREGDYRFLGVHVGESLGPVATNFSEFDPVGYTQNVIGQFMRFVQSTSGEYYFSRIAQQLERTTDITRLNPGEQVAASQNLKTFRVDLHDPCERERQERAKEAAAAKKKKKRSKISPSERPEGNAAQGTGASASVPVAAKMRPRPKKAVLSENANEALRRKIELLPEGERHQEIMRLNTLSLGELMKECEHAKAEGFGCLAHDDLPNFFPSDLNTIPALPALPDDPAAPVSFAPGIFGSPSRSNFMLIDPDLHIPSLTDFTAPTMTLPADAGQDSGPVITSTLVVAPAVPAAASIPVANSDGTPALGGSSAGRSASPATTLLDDEPADDSSRLTPPATSDSQVNMDGAPGWLVQHYKTFAAEAIPIEVAADWSELLRDWIAFEREMKFASPVRP